MKLLIVDDDADLRRLLAEHFEGHFDAEVFKAATPGEALHVLEEEQPEGMLLDINLGTRLNGLDILARQREISPGTKVIMVTSVSDFASIERAMELGAVDYITKPFTADYLEEAVNAKIAQHLMCA
ncbi:MAG TPA: response regulator [Verrucomicrobiae bacterium]|nr:response regulator [Verrucomicrobiae bacterium]